MRKKNIWWIKYRKRLYKKRNHLTTEMILRKSFLETLKEYLENCSVGGVTQIRYSTSKLKRLFWIIIFFFSFSFVATFLRSTWLSVLTKPLIVTSESVIYPINKMEFPAVAFCNMNRISKKAVKEYALKMSLKYKNVSVTELEKYLQYMGRLIDYRFDKSLHENISSLKPYHFNVNDIMKELAPKCEEMLIKCQWAGKKVNCSDIFRPRRTGFGHCCTFNYVLRLNAIDIHETVKRQVIPGSKNGLMVVADPLVHDYTYRLGSNYGFQVLIFGPHQFPDRAGGRMLYRIAQPGHAEFMQVDSIKQYATDEVRKYPLKTRECLFRNERKALYRHMYSYSACLGKCRIKSILSLCKCKPYFYPHGIFENEEQCTLKDLWCLNKFKEKFLYLYPKDTSKSGLEAEFADSLYCPECLPDCELTQHFTRDYTVTLAKITSAGFENKFLMDADLTNKSFINIYRPSPVGVLHRLDVVSYWFEILSNIGGFAGMVMGLGCYTFVEIIYFVTIHLGRSIYINYNKYH